MKKKSMAEAQELYERLHEAVDWPHCAIEAWEVTVDPKVIEAGYKARECWGCSKPFVMKKDTSFHSAECEAEYNNRPRMKGSTTVDLFKALQKSKFHEKIQAVMKEPVGFMPRVDKQ